MAVSGPSVTDLLLTAQVRTTDNDDTGLIYRYQDVNNYSVAIFNPENRRVRIEEITDRTKTTLVEVTDVDPLIFNTLGFRNFALPVEVAVWVEQQNVRVFANGRLLTETTEAQVRGPNRRLLTQ